MHLYYSATCFRPSCCWLSSGIQGHRAPGSEQLAQSTQDTAAWLATEGRSGARRVLWGKPISSIWFQTRAIWLIASVRRIKMRFHGILSTQHCISEEGKLISKRANGVRFTAQREADERSLIGVTLGKNTNIPAWLLFCALQTLQPSLGSLFFRCRRRQPLSPMCWEGFANFFLNPPISLWGKFWTEGDAWAKQTLLLSLPARRQHDVAEISPAHHNDSRKASAESFECSTAQWQTTAA